MLAAWAMVLLTGQLTLPKDRVIPVSRDHYDAMTRETFDAVLLYRTSAWLVPDVQTRLSAQEFVKL
jgi:hypothetical protein